MKVRQGLTFDDVLLVPRHSSIKSRADVDLHVDLGKGVRLGMPLCSTNMTNVTGPEMAMKISSLGGLPILHRFVPNPLEDIPQMYKDSLLGLGNVPNSTACSIGVKNYDYDLVSKLFDIGCKIICIDVAHGDNDNCVEMTEYVAKTFPSIFLISGSVATKEGALRLYNAGADAIRTGIGNGSLCTTRVETGNGVPQLTALEDVYLASDKGKKFKVFADGGHRRAGDIVKALCFSHVAMLGNMLAGTDEAPGSTIFVDGETYKQYSGSSTHKTNHIEGVSALVKCKGPVARIINNILEGLRSGLSYQGCLNLEELKEDPEFVSISNAGLIESHPHDVRVI